jgi:hypothetical protein
LLRAKITASKMRHAGRGNGSSWRLAETVRHAIGKFGSHIVVVLVVEHVADVEDHRLIAKVFPPV